jgi:predicted Ser/Thr protein kinase
VAVIPFFLFFLALASLAALAIAVVVGYYTRSPVLERVLNAARRRLDQLLASFKRPPTPQAVGMQSPIRPWPPFAQAAQQAAEPVSGRCPVCGAEPPDDSPMGLCAQCLLKCALSNSDHAADQGEGEGTAAYQGPSPQAAPAVAEIAAIFPQLEVLELIGHGGMGTVYKARQTKLDRFVAVKVLPAEWGRDPAFAERFAREARALARLNHPHIVAVHDFGEANGLYYLVMEFVDGANLRHVLQSGRLQPQQALAIVPQICAALQYAHEEGIVHRDIKPENILLDKRGHVKIADFGLAKLTRRSNAEFTLTGSRQVMGTLDYMAPEQRTAPQEVDHRADIYALGVVFYEMLTGHLPLGRFAPPSDKPGVDARLDEVVFRALEREPGRRYQHISEIKTDVESIARAAPAPATAARVGSPAQGDIDLEMTRLRVKGPAAGLVIAGIIFLIQAIAMGAFIIETKSRYSEERMPAEIFWPLFQIGAVLVLVLTMLMIGGAIKLGRLEGYQLAMISVILGMLPFSFHVVLGLPVGLWALWVLSRPDVKAGFARTWRGSTSPPPKPKPTGLLFGKVKSAFGAMLTLIVHRPTAASSPPTPAAGQQTQEHQNAGDTPGPLDPRPGEATPIRHVLRTDQDVIRQGSGQPRGFPWRAILVALAVAMVCLLCLGVTTSLLFHLGGDATMIRHGQGGWGQAQVDLEKTYGPKPKIKSLYPNRSALWFHRSNQYFGNTVDQNQQIEAILRFADQEYLRLELAKTDYQVSTNTRCSVTVKPFPEELKKLEDRVWSQLETAFGKNQLEKIKPQMFPNGSLFPYGTEKVSIDIERDVNTGTWRFARLSDSGLGKSSQGGFLPEEYVRFWNH